MNDIVQAFEYRVAELVNLTNKLKLAIGDMPVSSTFRDAVIGFESNYENYLKFIDSGETERILKSVKNLGIYGVAISNRIDTNGEVSVQIKHLADPIGKLARELSAEVESHRSSFAPLSKSDSLGKTSGISRADVDFKRIKQFLEDQEKNDERVKRSLAENERRLIALDESLNGIEQKAKDTLSKIEGEYDKTVVDLNTKKDDVDKLMGYVSGRAIAGDFEKSAAAEQKAADWLRYASLFCMALIVGVLGYSFWETIQQDFLWQKSIFRVALAFLLSAPAAYLARESAKHRTQQYLHLQTALDLKAIDPYLSSLPVEIKQKIKGETATRLFGSRDFSYVGRDSYPINAQELLMEIFKKIDWSKLSSK